MAAKVLQRVCEENAYSQHALRKELKGSGLERRDRAFATRLLYGTLTWRLYLDAMLAQLVKGDLTSTDPLALSHLRIAAFQLLRDEGGTPPHAAISEAVNEVGARRPRLRGFVNGVLRNLQRQRDKLEARMPAALRERALPKWIDDTLSAAAARHTGQGLDATSIMRVWNAPAPVTLRVRKGERDALIAALHDEGYDAEVNPLSPAAIDVGGDINALLRDERFNERLCVQDAGAQLAALTLPAGLTGPILDACAGLGGKTLHLLDRYPDARIMAADIDPLKLEQIPESARLDTLIADLTYDAGVRDAAERLAKHGYTEGFQAVLLDAPCTALGTLGRHPEVRWTRQPEDVEEMAALQRQMLEQLAWIVAPGGWLVYVVCTFSKEETVAVVGDFLARRPEFVLESPATSPSESGADSPVDWSTMVDETGALSILPVETHHDGFFIARLRRQP